VAARRRYLRPPGRQSASARAALSAASPASTSAAVAANAPTEAECLLALCARLRSAAAALAAATTCGASPLIASASAALNAPYCVLGAGLVLTRALRRRGAAAAGSCCCGATRATSASSAAPAAIAQPQLATATVVLRLPYGASVEVLTTGRVTSAEPAAAAAQSGPGVGRPAGG
jgi:hypothetical protein